MLEMYPVILHLINVQSPAWIQAADLLRTDKILNEQKSILI